MTRLYSTRPDPVLSPADVARFWLRVEKAPGCWLWRGQPSQHHPQFSVGGQGYACYRISYLLCNGPIPQGLGVCHSCDNGRCVNPAHLWLGTQTDNIRDRDRKGRTPKGDQHYARLRASAQPRSRPLRAPVRDPRRPKAVLTEEQVREIRARFATGAAKKALARAYGVAPRTIRDLLTGKTWRAVS